jgi:hypothetical protein
MGQDSLRAILDSVFAAPDYRWVERPSSLAFVARWFEGLQRWLLAVREAHPLGFRLLLVGLGILLIVIVVHAGWILFHTVRAGGVVGVADAEPVFRRDRAWYRQEADRLAAAGRYVEAIQADFLALVLALDAFELLRFQPGKTPAEYGRESRLSPRAREEFRQLVQTLYGYAFARWPCGASEFASWRERSDPERYARAY